MSLIFQSTLCSRRILSATQYLCQIRLRKLTVQNNNYGEIRQKYTTFDDLMKVRGNEARRSLVIQVNSESSFTELYNYCSRFGDVKGVHHYTLSKGKEHFMLVEFNNEEGIQNLLSDGSSHMQEYDTVPIKTPFLWFRSDKSSSKAESIKNKIDIEESILITKNGCEPKSDPEIKLMLLNAESISHQIQILYDHLRLNDLSTRLRFLTARQIEVVLKSLYSNISMKLFGSSVNGFGKMGCDLDLVLRPMAEDSKDLDTRLVYHTKKSIGKPYPVRHMELIGDVLDLYVPGCSYVRRILQARIPIIKYNQDFVGVECDLSMTNLSGVYMSEMLYLYSSWDERVAPLVFVVRHWASCLALTNAAPGRWITNFSLTLLVLFFLQQKTRDGAILPSLNYLIKHAGKNDVRITEDQINCTFLRDIKDISKEDWNKNTSNLETLLLQFFEFYSQFDFNQKSISLHEGVAINKAAFSPLYIVNPLDSILNVSHNVSHEERDRICIEMRNAAWILESQTERSPSSWGLMQLFEKPLKKSMKQLLRVGNSHRLVPVSDLFNEDSESDKLKLHSNLSKENSNSDSSESVIYKSEAVRREVQNVKRATSMELEQRRKRLLHQNSKEKGTNATRRLRKS